MATETSRSLRFLVTGGAGFIGSHLCARLLDGGHSVAVLDNLSTGRAENLAPFEGNPNFKFTHADISNDFVLEQLASEADYIFHLAAAVGVKLIVDEPLQTIESNILGTDKVLRAATECKCRVLLASSSEVYGKNASVPFREQDDVLLGATTTSRWSYAVSKMAGEFMAFAYQKQFGLDATICRFFNTVGAGQSGQYGMVVPRFVQQALAGKPITVYGPGSQSRTFCDVRDVVEALVGLARHPDAGGRVYNVGGKREISIQQLAEKVKAMTGSGSEIVNVPYDEAYEPGFEDIGRRISDTTRLRDLTGWSPQWTLEDTLSSVIEYERKRLAQSEQTDAAGDIHAASGD